jgi:predicted Zn-dependent protease
LLRIQEAEADQLGLIIMAQAGFDPQSRINLLKKAVSEEEINLNDRERLPDFLSTYPGPETRLKLVEAGFQECKAIFENTP